MALNTVTTIRNFFTEGGHREVKMDEMKALNSAERLSLAEQCKAEMIRRGTHKAEDFDFSAAK